jgi:hypothetical protein
MGAPECVDGGILTTMRSFPVSDVIYLDAERVRREGLEKVKTFRWAIIMLFLAAI